ncbi:hypothetical protein I4U23_007122 [Adineta vaga]|nr:hypothetical protein I4U23_007122 [Adineta vaga]
MPTTLSSDRYSAVSSSSASSTSSNSCYNNNNNKNNNNRNSLSQSSRSSTTFLPLRSATSSLHLSKLNNTNYHSMQSLKIQQKQQQQQQQQQHKTNQTPVARITPRIITTKLSTNDLSKDQDEGWLSCEELETIEKRFNDLLQEPKQKKSILVNKNSQHDQRAKSCDRLAMADDNSKLSLMSIPRQSLINKKEDETLQKCSLLPTSLIYDNNTRPRAQTPHQIHPSSTRTVLTANDILKVESSYRSIGTQVFACHCLCDLYITTADRLAKLEDWILFQHGLPVWLLNSGNDPKRQSRFSLIIAEHGSGFPIWEDTINGFSDVKQARAQHITFRLSDQKTLAVLRFNDLTASKEFYSYYKSIRCDTRYEHLFTTEISSKHHRSSSCGSLLRKRQKNQKSINKSSISNPCQFQHITCLQVKDRVRLITLDQCLIPCHNYSNEQI